MLKLRRLFLCTSLLVLFSCLASANTINSLVVYGDSLSDNGNLFATIGYPPPPYFDGRFSNGPVAVEQLASMLNLPLTDFAWGGATTGIGNHVDGGSATNLGAFGLPGMTPIVASTAPAVAPNAANTLFVVWGGPNDFFSPSPLDATPIDTANRAVADLIGIVNTLQGLGAQSILVPGMPDLGLTPSFMSGGMGAEGSAITDYFNSLLLASLPAGVMYYDTASLMRSVVANPAKYGLTNVTDSCFTGTSVCANPGSYLFWDGVHPTTAADTILASGFAATVPEPASIVLVMSSMAVIGVIRRRKHAA